MALQPGQVLQNRYRVVSVMGQGGMGSVYRAYDLRLRVPCIIKELIINPDQAGSAADAAAQFQREANALAGLHHSNLPRVSDYFSEQGSYYLVEELIEGQSLDKLIGAHGLPEATVLYYAGQLLDVLDYIHHNGVLHRDIKPSNIIIQSDGRAVLVDFGLVKTFSAGNLPATKAIIQGVGTPEYAPPEQYGGGTDQRSDLYSLGATLYHALTGQLPATATQQMAGVRPLVPPRQFNSQVSANTEQVILTAMSLNRAVRYPDAAAMRAALQGRATPAIAPAQRPAPQPALKSTVVLPPGAQPPAAWMPSQPQAARSGGTGTGLLIGIAAIVLVILIALGIAVPKIIALDTSEPTVISSPTPPATARAVRASATLVEAVPAATATSSPSQPAATAAPRPTRTPQPQATPAYTPPPTSTPIPAASATPFDILPTATNIPKVVELSSPQNGQVLQPVTNVMGSVTCQGFNYYKLNLWSLSNDVCKPCVLPASGDHSMVSNGRLLQWDTTGVLAGDYRLELVAVCFGTEQDPKPSVNVSIRH